MKIVSLIGNTDLKATSVQLCSECRGNGFVPDNSWGSGMSDTLTCPSCRGCGRTKRVIVSATIEIPFSMTDPEELKTL